MGLALCAHTVSLALSGNRGLSIVAGGCSGLPACCCCGYLVRCCGEQHPWVSCPLPCSSNTVICNRGLHLCRGDCFQFSCQLCCSGGQHVTYSFAWSFFADEESNERNRAWVSQVPLQEHVPGCPLLQVSYAAAIAASATARSSREEADKARQGTVSRGCCQVWKSQCTTPAACRQQSTRARSLHMCRMVRYALGVVSHCRR